MEKDKRIFDVLEVAKRVQDEYELNLATRALKALFPSGILDENKITMDTTGKNECPGCTSTLKYDGKVLFRREYDGGFSFRYESPAFGDVLD
jgi:hypothetical protein